MSRRRVVVTGMGVISPQGESVDTLYQAQIAGKSAVGWITRFDASSLPTKIAAECRNFNLAKHIEESQRYQGAGLNSQFALAATKYALKDAGLLGNKDLLRSAGVYLGAGEGRQDFENLMPLIAKTTISESMQVDNVRFCKDGMHTFGRDAEREQEMHTVAGNVARQFHLGGPNYACLTACAAGSQAIGEGADIIRRGEADVMVTGGSHTMIHPFGVTGFNLLTALCTHNDDPTKASCPFDFRRNGFVMGEGAGILVLEELEHAKKRGATILAELAGYGTTADAYRVTDSCPDGRGAVASMREALKDAGLVPTDIGYINAHGTSTVVNDKGETAAIKTLLGSEARKVPVSSSKSMMGHLIAAAGAVEAIICVMTLKNGILPPTINYEHPDPDCDLDYVPNVAREKKVSHIMSNSFGFGGQNVALIVSKI
ncbi:MAG TPA: beta-ketoacyl-ACP synthase II [Gemmatales bacterium]|nr:beta-ketoacyl-ACP synthase II [Gemmatales bacterium]